MRIIETERLRKTFVSLFTRKKVHALQGVDLAIEKGQIFGLLGPNGAGKTTLVKILLGICYSSAGAARLFDIPVERAASRRSVGYLPENHKYPTFLKGRHVMHYYAQLSGMHGSERAARVDDLLRLVRMGDWAGTKMGKYSKGMQQRVGMAVAMVADPNLLVLDEPTDGVDPIGRKEIRDILLDLKERGKTIFLNSHLLSEVELVCDRIAILNRGKVVTEGTVDELTKVENIWSIMLQGAPDDTFQLLAEKGMRVVSFDAGQLKLETADVSELNQAIDAIRAQGILITSLVRKRLSLEEMFIDVIEREGGATVK